MSTHVRFSMYFQKGIYADMAAGIRKSKLMLACISDEVRKPFD